MSRLRLIRGKSWLWKLWNRFMGRDFFVTRFAELNAANLDVADYQGLNTPPDANCLIVSEGRSKTILVCVREFEIPCKPNPIVVRPGYLFSISHD